MQEKEFAQRAQKIRGKLYKTAVLYLGSHSQAVDALDEAIYKGLCACRRLRESQYFDTWLTRILINVCNDELSRQKRICPIDEMPEMAAEQFDALPLKDAIERLPKELREIVILRYFSGFTLSETAKLLGIPQGTVVTRQRRALQLLRLSLDEEVTA